MKLFIFYIFSICLLVSSVVQAKQYRVYCQPQGLASEYREGEDYTQENVTIPNVPWLVIDQKDIPSYQYFEQLKCSGKSLTVDRSIKPEWAIKKETLESNQVALDAELEKAQPDVIEVARLQRSIEKLKRGK